MLDPWIIEEILRREEEQKQPAIEQRIDVPIERPRIHESESKRAPTEQERGVVVIDI